MARDNSISLKFLGIATAFPPNTSAALKLKYGGKIKSTGIASSTPHSYKMEFCGRIKFWGIGVVTAPESIIFYIVN